MNTMNLATTTSTTIQTTDQTAHLTTLDSAALEAWFAEVGLTVTQVEHCASASCPVCFRHEVPEAAQAA